MEELGLFFFLALCLGPFIRRVFLFLVLSQSLPRKTVEKNANQFYFHVSSFGGDKLGTDIKISLMCKILVNYNKKERKEREKQGQTTTSPTLSLCHDPFASFIEQEKGKWSGGVITEFLSFPLWLNRSERTVSRGSGTL